MRSLGIGLALIASALIIFPGCAAKSKLAERDAEIMSLRGERDGLAERLRQAELRAQELESDMEKLAEREQLYLDELEAYRVLRLPDRLLFAFGKAEITRPGQELLDRIANVFSGYPDHEIRVEGHADNRPIKPEFVHKFASNWELSTARATAVVRYLITKHGMNPRKLVAVGRGEHHPVASNDTDNGRAENRRVEFHIAKQPTIEELNP